jgi:hypothetical protein
VASLLPLLFLAYTNPSFLRRSSHFPLPLFVRRCQIRVAVIPRSIIHPELCFTKLHRPVFPHCPFTLAPSNPAALTTNVHASLENEESRRSANMEFLSICLSLANPGPGHTLFDPVNRRPSQPEQNIFPPKPCHHAHHKILSYLDMTCPALLHNSGRTYLAGILSANGIDFQQAYRGSFLTNKFFGSILNMESWLVSPHANLRQAQIPMRSLPSIFLTSSPVSLVSSLMVRIFFQPQALFLCKLDMLETSSTTAFPPLTSKKVSRHAPSSLLYSAFAFSPGFISLMHQRSYSSGKDAHVTRPTNGCCPVGLSSTSFNNG